MWNVGKKLKRCLYLLAVLVVLQYVNYLFKVWGGLTSSSSSYLYSRTEENPLDKIEGVRGFKEPYLSSDYILVVKSSSRFKSTAEWLLKYLKLSVKTKILADSFSIQKPLPYLVVFDESTIVRFLKESQFHNSRNIIQSNSIPIIAICSHLEVCNAHSRALVQSVAYYKSYLRTTDNKILQILKNNHYYNANSNSLAFLLDANIPGNIQALLEIPSENVDFSKLPKLTAEQSKSSKLIAAYYDPGTLDSFPKVVIGGDLSSEIVHKIIFLEAANFLTKKQLSFGLKRLIQVDVDDALMPAKLRENALTKSDIDAMVKFQDEISSSFIKNFKFKLGFCGDFYTRGRHPEEIEAFKYLVNDRKKEFSWFPHLFRHYQPHNLTFSKLREEMVQNRKFAHQHGLTVDGTYAVSPHHSGVYPVLDSLFQLWKDIWNISVTSTEQYPHLKSVHGRKGFVHADIAVLPRQLCGLYTKTLRFTDYPGGIVALDRDLKGGDTFLQVLLNPVAIFMTHIGNFGADRLGLYAFEKLFQFIGEHTNLHLVSATPAQLSTYHFSIFPDQQLPQWTNPCDDKRHMEIVPRDYKCDNLPQVVIVGPQKSGSTAFQFFLSAHPDFATSLPSAKTFEEVQFFDNDNTYKKGVDWYKQQFPIMARSNQINFEKSASYYDKYKVPARIFSLLPRAKIVMILRDPIDRAYSWYLHEMSSQSNVYKNSTFSSVINANMSSYLNDFKSKTLGPGFYYKHIRRWAEMFSLNNMYFVDGDAFIKDPANQLQMFLKWFKPQIANNFNFSSIVEYNPSKGLFCLVQGIAPKSCLGPSKGRSFGNSNHRGVNISSTDKQFLLNAYYSDTKSLEKFLVKRNFTVPSWVSRLMGEASSLLKKDLLNQNDDVDDTEPSLLQMPVGTRR